MLKNEEKRLYVTLNSVVGAVDSIIVYDTGSTDSTPTILDEFAKKYTIPLYVKNGEFVNFSVSRNEALDFADTIGTDFLLLMDCNDELRGKDELRRFCTSQMLSDETAWMVSQEWFSGVHTKYYNVRLLKSGTKWRYRGVVHEWIQNQDNPDCLTASKAPDAICLFQDRTQDDDKTGKRFHRDRELLQQEHKHNPDDARTVFYLAQTYSCLALNKDAYHYYEIRSRIVGFYEEVFHCFMRMGDIANEWENQWELALNNYMKAFEHSPRAEPVIAIAEHYRSKGKWLLSFHFARMACELDFPRNSVLFVDDNVYTYTRYHLLGIVAFYCARFQEGYDACKKAIEVGGHQVDIDNLVFYENVLFPLQRGRRCK